MSSTFRRRDSSAQFNEEEEKKHFDSIFEGPVKPVDLGSLKIRYANFKQGRRIAPRYGVHFDVILYTRRGFSFRTKSVNVSASGALLADLLPHEFMNGLVDIVFVRQEDSSKKYMAFRGKAIGGPLRSPRITFITSSSNAEETLLGVLQDLTPLSEFNAS